MKNNNYTNNYADNYERTHYINDETKGEVKMTNRDFNSNGRHFKNEDAYGAENARTRWIPAFYDINSCSTGYERNIEVIKARDNAYYNDDFVGYNKPEAQGKQPVPKKKKGIKSKVIAIVMASIATASAIAAGFVVMNSMKSTDQTKAAVTDSVKAANAAKLKADKAIAAANKLKLEKQNAEKKAAEEAKKAEEVKKAEEAKKAEAEKKAAEAKKAAELKKAEEAKKAEIAKQEAEKKAIEAKKAELEKKAAQLEAEQKKFESEKKEAEQNAKNKAEADVKTDDNNIINTNQAQ